MSDTFTSEERAAIKERAQELRTEPKRGKAKPDAESDQLAKIAELAEPDRVIAERLHALVKEHAPSLTPKLWYGMPGWAKDGKILCFYQPAVKFKTRYGTLGFNDNASLDDGTLWPTAFALAELTAANEKKIIELLRRAVG